MSGLKVVCLISGGKDSLFSILHCLANGHEVVALTNLYPPYNDDHNSVEDLDSYMYQTIGHSVIPLYEKALGLPLYRHTILGTALNQDKCYSEIAGNQEDETEDLLTLLRKVKIHHPDINAVSTGAILSDYQRTRVESVALRLGLTPLSYLWQYPNLLPNTPKSLLEHMGAVGQDSRIIKVASGGLDSNFLWQNVADARTVSRLDKASRLFGSTDDGAILGEGGEYETLAVSGPAPLWKGRIVVPEDHRTAVLGDAGSASVHISEAYLETNDTVSENALSVPMPLLLEPRFQTMLATLQGSNYEEVPCVKEIRDEGRRSNERFTDDPENSSLSSTLTANGHSLLASVIGDGSNASEQMLSIMNRVDRQLLELGKSFHDIAYTSIILRDMADFAAINSVYSTYFSYPNPPARATIACTPVLPQGKHVMVSFTVVDQSSDHLREGLHVQSRSYWAPANIGPYSQAVSVPVKCDSNTESATLVYVAGQIPLIPASMELAISKDKAETSTFLFQTVLALQHAVRIGRAMHVGRWVCAIAFIMAESAEAAISRCDAAQQAWTTLHHEQELNSVDAEAQDSADESFDIWDVTYGSAQSRSYVHETLREQRDLVTASTLETPPLYVLRVDALPRNADIEWVVYGCGFGRDLKPHDIPHLCHLLEVFRNNIISGR